MRNVDIAASIGTELFIMDAGWWDKQGDWEPSKSRFPRGLDPIVEYVHGKGMLFGLYGEIEKAGATSRIATEHPDWIEWHKPYPVLNLSRPEVAAYMEKALGTMIEGFRLDLFRLDFNTPSDVPFEGVSNMRGGLEENNFARYYNQFNSIFDSIHKKYPSVILQQAACGGGRNDFETAGRFHEQYLTDGLRVPYVVQNFCGQTLALPPEVMIIAIGADGGGGTGNSEDFETYLRVTFTLSTPWIFFGMTAPDLNSFDPDRLASFQRYAALYKDFIRPLWPDCLVFHHSPVSAYGGVESGSTFAEEFASPDRKKGWCTLIKIQDDPEPLFTFRPRGIDPSATYNVTLDNERCTVRMEGLRFRQEGLTMRLEGLGASEMVLYEAIQ